MSPRIFTESERQELKTRMLELDLPFLCQYGMTHMSVEKITEDAK